MSEVLHFSLNLSFQPINHAVHDIAHVYLNKKVHLPLFYLLKPLHFQKFYSFPIAVLYVILLSCAHHTFLKNQQLLVYQPFLQFPSLLFQKYSLLISPQYFFPYNQNLFSLSSDCAFLSHTAQ